MFNFKVKKFEEVSDCRKYLLDTGGENVRGVNTWGVRSDGLYFVLSPPGTYTVTAGN